MDEGDILFFVEAIRPYTPKEVDADKNLTLKVGDILAVSEVIGESLYAGVDEKGKAGQFPASHVRLFDPPSDEPEETTTKPGKQDEVGLKEPKKKVEAAPTPPTQRQRTRTPSRGSSRKREGSGASSSSSSAPGSSLSPPSSSSSSSSSSSPAQTTRPMQVSELSTTTTPPHGSKDFGPSPSKHSSISLGPMDSEHLIHVIRELQDKVITTKSEKDILLSRVEYLENEKRRADEERVKNHALIRERNELQERIRFFHLQSEQWESDRRDLLMEIERLKKEIVKAQDLHEGSKPERQRVFETVQNQNRKLQDDLNEAQRRVAALELEISEIRSKDSDLRSTKKLVDSMREENLELKRQLYDSAMDRMAFNGKLLTMDDGSGDTSRKHGRKQGRDTENESDDDEDDERDREHLGAVKGSGLMSQQLGGGGSGGGIDSSVSSAIRGTWEGDTNGLLIIRTRDLELERIKNGDLKRELEAMHHQLILERGNVEMLSHELRVSMMKFSSSMSVPAPHLTHGITSPDGTVATSGQRKESRHRAKEIEAELLKSRVNTETMAAFHLLNRTRAYRDVLRAQVEDMDAVMRALRREGLLDPLLRTYEVQDPEVRTPINEKISFLDHLETTMEACLKESLDHYHEAVALEDDSHGRKSGRYRPSSRAQPQGSVAGTTLVSVTGRTTPRFIGVSPSAAYSSAEKKRRNVWK
eukprot:TRINITY_DN490_c0_g1_i1.p1 TRINITY_DN490_c0_g1~~TRINITY_DN490_c0_g1_i1.p1  ORF type:complete len:700 (-),score=233.15 TRINITY_DN490_c0_g1_i1:152-2251(-)